jgi:hypothetical protein
MIEQSPILITGIPRSGASMIARAINMCGAFGGNISKRGMWVNPKIRYELVEPFLIEMNVDKRGQFPLPNIYNIDIPNNWRELVESIMIEDGFKQGQWMYKDSRSCLLWPLWHSAFPEAKWIIVRRKTGSVIESCIKTAYMDAFKYELNQYSVKAKNEHDGWLWWVHEYEKRFMEMIEAGLNCRIINPSRMVHGDYQQVQETLEWLGLEWNKSVVDLIDPLLQTTRVKERSR